MTVFCQWGQPFLDRHLPTLAYRQPTYPNRIAPVVAAIAPSAPSTVITDTSEFVPELSTPPSDGGSLNWFMIIVVAVVAILTIVFSLYIMIIYQHPEDRNQAWFPKIVVIFGMTIAIYSVLMFPLDVTNSQVCSTTLPLVDCSTTFPMDLLWQIVYIANIVTVFVLVPFAFFYYEGDSEWSGGRKLLSSFLWTLAIVIIVVVVIGIPYILAGFATYKYEPAYSGLQPVSILNSAQVLQLSNCIPVQDVVDVGTNACAATSSRTGSFRTRVSLITYAMAIVATVGWLLFLVFAAIGMVSLPLDWIRQFISRPRTTITKKQYIERAKDLARRAKDIQFVAEALKKDRKQNGRSRKWRKNYSAVQSQVQVLMDDNDQLERVYPQGEDPAATWVMVVMGYWLKLFAGVAALALTVCWILQIILYVLIDPPVSPFLNDAFISANDVFALFGTILFGIFVFYLQGCVVKGNFKFGLNFLVFRVHPIKRGATVMSSMLFNTALVLLATTATIQFCAQAFALYAGKSAIYNIFGVTLSNLDGLKYLYVDDLFTRDLFVFLRHDALSPARSPDPRTRQLHREHLHLRHAGHYAAYPHCATASRPRSLEEEKGGEGLLRNVK